ncbi:uncharacterized protein LOC135129886 [Zophobas morio]|uniref:uncharacterized protein LOC135129886 n=1 Tax=Zophobas morio TaxID=2755281 RepID=UPI0030838C20
MAHYCEDYFQLVLTFYHFTGLKKSSNSLSRVISLYILYPLLLTVFVMAIINFRYNYHSVSGIVEVFMSATSFGYMVLFKTLLIIFKPIFEDLISQRTSFWKYHLLGTLTEKKCHKRMSLSLSIIKFLLVSEIFSISVHSAAPLFMEKLDLPHPCWIPGNNNKIRIVVYVLQVTFYVEVVFLLIVVIGFFLMMCTELKIQFELLCRMVSSINIEETGEKLCWQQLKHCYKYHYFLLRMHDKLNTIFSGYFVCAYFLTIGGTCLPLFVMFDPSSSFGQIAEGVFFITITNAMFTLSARLADEIYSVDWYNANLKILKFVLFWMAQAQIPVQMSGAGVFQVNRTLLLRVQRLGYSISTLMTGLK